MEHLKFDYFYRPQRSCGKVMVLQVSVILFTGGGSGPGGVPGPWGMPGRDPPDGYCCGRYAAYWNAFLLLITFAYEAKIFHKRN